MRNLKRTLSLLLAAIMLIGMMVVGASAADVYDSFTDKDEIVNKDAVSLLTILGVVDGKGGASDPYFDPTDTVTRGQMAKMISVVLNKGVDNGNLYNDLATGLTDVAGRWDTGYINYCYSRDIIAGRGNGKFDPEATVTAAEAAKMLLVAAGYNPEIEGFVGASWAIKVNSKASSLGIYDNYTGTTMEPLSRDDAALLIYNALDVEMIESYTTNNYALVYNDRRTILGEMYGVYKVKGVVDGNEWARLQETDYDERLADGKTSMDKNTLAFYTSNTLGTNTGNSTNANNNNTGINLSNLGLVNVSTPEEYLGRSVNMYIRKTTVLNDYEVLGVYLRDEDNSVIETAELIDFTDADNTLKTLLKNTGLTTGSTTKLYVNYGYVATGYSTANMNAVNDRLKLEDSSTLRTDRHVRDGDDVIDNHYGIELTVIDNNRDGVVDYVLWMQEDLTQITDVDDVRDTVNFQPTSYYPYDEMTKYNNGRPIDMDDVVFVDDADEGDVVLVRTYGGRYYVSQPDVITGKMESYSADRTQEQYIVVDGETYHASHIKVSADGEVEDLYAFDVAQCAEKNNERAVQWDITYDFYMDSNGHIAAFKPSERIVPNYALILESGYDPGVYATDASGKVTVVLSDGTQATYNLDFSASAQNLADQIEASGASVGTADYDKAFDRTKELKGFLGTDYTDTSDSRPWNSAAPTANYLFAEKDTVKGADGTAEADGTVDTHDYKSSKAAGYVITYTLDENNVLTIQSVVGSASQYDSDSTAGTTMTHVPGYNLGTYHVDTVSPDYDKGEAQLNHTAANPSTQNYMAIDLNTVAFYFWTDNGENKGSAVIGYNNMVNIKSTDVAAPDTKDFIATNTGARYNDGAYVSPTGTNLAEMILFAHKGPESAKNYVYILGRNNHYDNGNYVDLFGVDTNGKAVTLKIKRSEWTNKFDGDPDAYKKVWQYSTDANGVSTLTATQENTIATHRVILGSVLRLTDGTVAFTAENTYGGNYYNINSYLTKSTYDKSYALATEVGHVWNVRNLAVDSDAPQGSISTNSPKHAIIILDKAEPDATKIDTAYVWDYTADEKTAPASVSIAAAGGATTLAKEDSLVFTATPANLVSPHYQWKVDGVNVGTDSATYTMNGADFDAGAHNVTVEWTDQYHSTPTSVGPLAITVSAAAEADSIAATNVKLYDATGTELETITKFGSTEYVVPTSGDVVVMDSTSVANPIGNGYVEFGGTVYPVSNNRVTIPVSALDGKTTINRSEFTQYFALNMANGIVPTSATAGNVISQEGAYYGKTGATDIMLDFTNATDGAAAAIAVAAADTATSATAISNTSTAISAGLAADTWVKGAAAVTLANGGGTDPAVTIATKTGAAFTSGHYVAIGTTLYVVASAAGESVTAAATTAGTINTLDDAEDPQVDPPEYTYVVNGVDVTLTDSSN